MGMSIDEDIKTQHECVSKTIDTLWEMAQKNQQLQADYEARLKADMAAMLSEIQLDIEKHTMTSGVTNQGTWNECIACCSRVIQQKINSLNAEKQIHKGANNE